MTLRFKDKIFSATVFFVISYMLLAVGHVWKYPAAVAGYFSMLFCYTLMQLAFFSAGFILISRRIAFQMMAGMFLLVCFPILSIDRAFDVGTYQQGQLFMNYYGLPWYQKLPVFGIRILWLALLYPLSKIFGIAAFRFWQAQGDRFQWPAEGKVHSSAVKISWVIPFYNEKESAQSILQTLHRFEVDKPESWETEYLFIDDGSTDGTSESLKALQGSFEAKIVTHEQNAGFGAAIRTGFAHASGDIVVCYDFDSTYPVEDAVKLVSAVLEGADIATADPAAPGALMLRVSFLRRILTRGNSFLYQLVLGCFGAKTPTFSCAFRAYRAESIKNLKFFSDGFGAASEILGRLILQGAKIAVIPSPLSTRQFGTSKLKMFRTIRQHFVVLWKLAGAEETQKREACGASRAEQILVSGERKP